MTTKKQLGWENLCLLFFTYIAILCLCTTCMPVDDSFASSKLAIIDDGGIVFDSNVSSKTFEIESNRDWSVEIESGADWLSVNPMNGSKNTTKLTVKAKKNEGTPRKGSFKVTTSSLEKLITISQKGKGVPDKDADGEDILSIEYISIKDVRTMYEESAQNELIITEPLMLKAVVISDRIGANRSAKRDGYIQDEAGDGLAFRVAQAESMYALGDELSINLEDAKILYFDYAGILQIIFSTKSAEVLTQNVTIAPKELTIEEIQHAMYDGTLVKVKDVQFKNYKNLNYYGGEGNATTRVLESCNGTTLNVKTSKNASFKNNTLPAGKGDILGIVSLCKDNWELLIRNLDDVKEMSDDEFTRCKQEQPPIIESKISVADLRVMLSAEEIYKQEHYIEGEVILNAFKNNVPDNIVYLADETAGVSLIFSDKDKKNILTNVSIGSKVKVFLKGTKTRVVNGLLQVGDDSTLTTQSVEIIEKISSTPLHPKVATINEILAGKYQSELVKIENVQFKEVQAKYAEHPFIINETNKEVQVYTEKDAAFADETVSEGMGSIIAVASVRNLPQLLIRSIDDLTYMTGKRFGLDTPLLVVNNNKVVFKANGGHEAITITANVNWIALTDASWLSIAPTSGVNDAKVTIIANENDEEKERKATVTITNGAITQTINVIQNSSNPTSEVTTDLLFSEYIEGTSYNKYLEIYNGTGKTVDLSNYVVEVYMNGQSTAKYTQILEGFLINGEVIVLKNTKAQIYEGEAIASSAVNFNGNDAVALLKILDGSFVYIDIIGCIGEDPGKEWTAPFDTELTTKDKTLVRKSSIRVGVTKNPKNGFTTLGSEWISYPIDTSDYLGSHTMN